MYRKNHKAKLTLILSNLNRGLTNKYLHDYIFDKLEDIVNGNYKQIEILENGIYFVSKKYCDSFKITFEPDITNFSKIKTEYSCWDNRHTEEKQMFFDNERTTTIETETSICIFENKSIGSIKKKEVVCEYVDNQLVYKSCFENETDCDKNSKRSGSTEELIYILPDRSAVKVINNIRHSDCFNIEMLHYFKTNYCDEPNFDTRINSKDLYSYGMYDINSDEFKTIVDMWNKEYKQVVKSKNKKA